MAVRPALGRPSKNSTCAGRLAPVSSVAHGKVDDSRRTNERCEHILQWRSWIDAMMAFVAVNAVGTGAWSQAVEPDSRRQPLRLPIS